MPPLLRIVLIGLGVVAVQWLVLGRLQLWGAYPDAVLLYVAWLGLRQGRRIGAFGGFSVGLLMDVMYDTWGLHMLVKTAVGFMLGMFPASERETLLILPRQAFLGGLVIALVQNGILVILLALQTGTSDSNLVTGLWLGSALYTAFVGTIAALLSGR